MHTGIPRPLAHHPHMMAKGLASLGRGGDDTLVHMSHSEVQGLQQFAQSRGKSLTVNPDTGLPEAYSLKDLGRDVTPFVPAFAGAAADYFLPDSPILNAAAYGGIAKLAGADLPSAINAGLQFYGGEGLMSGLESSFGFGKGSGAGAGTTGDVGTTGNTTPATTQAIPDYTVSDPQFGAHHVPQAESLFGGAEVPAAASTGTGVLMPYDPASGGPIAAYTSGELPTDTTIPDYTVPDAQFGINHVAQTPQDYTPSLYHRLANTVEAIPQKAEDMWSGMNKAQKTGLTMAGTNILNSLTAPKTTNPAAANPARYYVSSTNQPLYSRKVNPDFLNGVPGAPPYIVTTSPGEYTTDASRIQHFKSGGGITALATGGPTTQQSAFTPDQLAVLNGKVLPSITGATPEQISHWQQVLNDYSSYVADAPNRPGTTQDQIRGWQQGADSAKANLQAQLDAYNKWNQPMTSNSALQGSYGYGYGDDMTPDPAGSLDQTGWNMAVPVGDMGHSQYNTGGMGGNFLGNVDTGYDQYAQSTQPQASDQSTPAQPTPADQYAQSTQPQASDQSTQPTSDSSADQSPWYQHPFSSLANAWDNTAVGGAIDSAGRYVGNELKKGEDYISNSGIGRAWREAPQLGKDALGGLLAITGGPLALPYLALNATTRNNGPDYGVYNTGVGRTAETWLTSPANPLSTFTNIPADLLKMGYNQAHLAPQTNALMSGNTPESWDLANMPESTQTQANPQVGRNMFQQHAAGGSIQGYAGGGGIASLGNTYAAGGKLLRGPGDGMSDSIPAVIGGQKPQQAALADGEFVIPADVVSHLGNGSTEAGSRKLYGMMHKIRKARTGKSSQAPQVNADKFLAR